MRVQRFNDGRTTAILAERARVARELHDGLAQDLAYVIGQIRRWEDGESAEQVLQQIASVAPGALDELRRTMLGLRVTNEESVEALVRKSAAHALRGSEDTALAIDIRCNDLPLHVREAIHRVVGEATQNAVRHGEARTISISLDRHDTALRLRILDDGQGMSDALRGLGITGMDERARALGGRLSIRSDPGGGTLVEMLLP